MDDAVSMRPRQRYGERRRRRSCSRSQLSMPSAIKPAISYACYQCSTGNRSYTCSVR